MTILNLAPSTRLVTATASASQTVFSINFDFQDNADIVVQTQLAAGGDWSTLTEGVDYTLTGANGVGDREVTLTAGATEDDKYRIVGAAVLERTGSITALGKFNPALTDAEFVRILMILQELVRDVGRAVKAELGSTGPDFPEPSADKILGWNEAGDALENKTDSAGGGGISELSEDTTPQLGGDLDLNGNEIAGVDATELGYVAGVTSAIQAQLDALSAALGSPFNIIGDWDASSGSFPGSGSAQTGAWYRVSGTGTVDGVVFATGDSVVALTDDASTSTYADEWLKIDATDAVTSVAGLAGTISASALRTALSLVVGTDVQDVNYTPTGTGAVERTVAGKLQELVSVTDFGAVGDGDRAAGTGTDNTTAIDAALLAHDELYVPAGIYKVTSLTNYALGKRFVGPGVIWATSAFQTPIYGNTLVAGMKIGNTFPLANHGGVLVGGAGDTPHGFFLKTETEDTLDFIASRDGAPTQIQYYSNAVQGYGDFSGTTFNATVTSHAFDDFLFVEDLIWFGTDGAATFYRVGSITDENTLVIKDEDGSAADAPATAEQVFWSFYRTTEHVGDLSSGVFTITAGDIAFEDGDDINVIVAGTRYEVSAIDYGAQTITIASPPSDDTDLTILLRQYSGEEYIAKTRYQTLRAGGKEMTVGQGVRPDFAYMRIGATGSGTDDYAYYLPFHFLTGRSSEKVQTGGESNMTGEGYTAWTVQGQGQHVGKVGVGVRNPTNPLMVRWDYFNSGTADNTVKEIGSFGAQWQGGNGHRVGFLQRNADYGGGIQGYSTGSMTKTLCLQPQGGGVYVGGWGDPSAGYLVEYAAPIKAQTVVSKEAPLSEISGTTHTVAAADAGLIKVTTNGSAVTITIPKDATDDLPDGFTASIMWKGAGTPTIAAEDGDVDLNGVAGGSVAIGNRYSAVVLIKHGENDWTITGDIGTVS